MLKLRSKSFDVRTKKVRIIFAFAPTQWYLGFSSFYTILYYIHIPFFYICFEVKK